MNSLVWPVVLFRFRIDSTACYSGRLCAKNEYPHFKKILDVSRGHLRGLNNFLLGYDRLLLLRRWIGHLLLFLMLLLAAGIRCVASKETS